MIQTKVSDRFVDAAQMFGEANMPATEQLPDAASAAASGTLLSDADPMFQGLCIVLLFCIALLMRYRHELRALLEGLVRGFPEDYESNRKLTALTGGFFKTATVTGLITVTVFAVKYSSLWFPPMLQFDPLWKIPVAAVCVAATLLAVSLYQRLMLLAIGFVTGGRDFADTLLYVKKACFATTALFLSPVVVLSALSEPEGRGWLYCIAGECFILSLIFLKETIVLFIRKKIPIFQWFLYLCTVEAFPLTLICASIARFR